MAAALLIAVIAVAVCTAIVGVTAYRVFTREDQLQQKELKARRKRK